MLVIWCSYSKYVGWRPLLKVLIKRDKKRDSGVFNSHFSRYFSPDINQRDQLCTGMPRHERSMAAANMSYATNNETNSRQRISQQHKTVRKRKERQAAKK